MGGSRGKVPVSAMSARCGPGLAWLVDKTSTNGWSDWALVRASWWSLWRVTPSQVGEHVWSLPKDTAVPVRVWGSEENERNHRGARGLGAQVQTPVWFTDALADGRPGPQRLPHPHPQTPGPPQGSSVP